MQRINRFSLAVAAGLLLTAGIAYADAPMAGENVVREAALAKIPVSQAIAQAEQTAGGRAISANMSASGSRDLVYQIDVAATDKIRTVIIDAETGALLGNSEMPIIGDGSVPGQGSEAQAAAAAKLDLGQAVREAAQQAHGKPVEASITTSGSQPVYDVEILSDGALRSVSVDTQSGRIL